MRDGGGDGRDGSRVEQWRTPALPTPPPPFWKRRWPVLQELLSGTSGGSDGAREEVLRRGAPARHPKNHRQEALGKMLPSPVNSDGPGRRRHRRHPGPVPPNRRQTFWSNSDIHFDIVHRRRNKQTNRQKKNVSSSKVQ